MTSQTRWTYVLLVGSFLLICVGAYVLVTQASDLRSSRQQLQSTERELAEKQAQLLVVSDALISNRDQARIIANAFGNISKNCSRPDALTAPMRAVCATTRWASSPAGQFVPAYVAATVDRASAASDDQWTKVKAEYGALRGMLPENTLGASQWLARVEEGVAYADYRLGNLDAAEKQAESAAKLDNRSAFVALTRLKIACSQQRPKRAIAELYAAQRGELEEAIKSPTPGIMTADDARIELGYYDRDPEVRLMCRYAELPAAKKA